MEHTSEFFNPEPGLRTEEEKRTGRRAALALPFFALAACEDDDDPAPAMMDEPPGGNGGENGVAFTVRTDTTNKNITAENAATPNLLSVTLSFSDEVEAGTAGADADDTAELAAAIFEITTDSAGNTPASNFEIRSARFLSGTTEVAYGTGDGELLGEAGAMRGDFDSVVLTIHSVARGTDAAEVDLYIKVATNGLAEADDGMTLTLDDEVESVESDLVADGDGSAPATVEPDGRNEGEVVVSFTVQEDGTSGISAMSFSVTSVVNGMEFAGNVLVTASLADSDGRTITGSTTLSEGDVVVATFSASPTAQFVSGEVFTSNSLDYTIGLFGNQGGLVIDGMVAADGQGMAFLTSTDDYTRTNYDTKAPEIDSVTGSAMMVTVTFDEDLLAASVQARDFTVTDSSNAAVSVSAAMLVAGNADQVALTLEAAWANTHTVSIAAMAIQDASGVYNGALTTTPMDADTVTPTPAPGPTVSMTMTMTPTPPMTVTDQTMTVTDQTMTVTDQTMTVTDQPPPTPTPPDPTPPPDPDPAPTPTPPPPARNHGEVVVSFTIQDEATSGLSADSFQISVGTGNSAMLLTDADVTVQTSSGTALTAATTLSAMDVIVVTFNSPSGKLTADDLDYEVELSGGLDRGGLQIGGVAATNPEALAFLASAGEALAREDYKTTGPVFQVGSIDSNDDATLTLTFSEDLHPGSVQVADFTVTDSNGVSVAVQDAELVEGDAAEVRLTLVRDLSTDSGDVAIEAGALQSAEHNIGNPADPTRITPIDEARLGSSLVDYDTYVEVPYATPEQKIITPDTATEPNLLFAVLLIEDGIDVQIGTGGMGTTSAEIARSVFELQTDPIGTGNPERFVDSANFEIHDASFVRNDVTVVDAGTGDLELLGPLSGPGGNRRGDFDAIVFTIDSRARSGSADAPVDLYLVAAEDALALPDGTPLDSNDLELVFLGADLVAGV